LITPHGTKDKIQLNTAPAVTSEAFMSAPLKKDLAANHSSHRMVELKTFLKITANI
jgi:hypothetical protein